MIPICGVGIHLQHHDVELYTQFSSRVCLAMHAAYNSASPEFIAMAVLDFTTTAKDVGGTERCLQTHVFSCSCLLPNHCRSAQRVGYVPFEKEQTNFQCLGTLSHTWLYHAGRNHYNSNSWGMKPECVTVVLF